MHRSLDGWWSFWPGRVSYKVLLLLVKFSRLRHPYICALSVNEITQIFMVCPLSESFHEANYPFCPQQMCPLCEKYFFMCPLADEFMNLGKRYTGKCVLSLKLPSR